MNEEFNINGKKFIYTRTCEWKFKKKKILITVLLIAIDFLLFKNYEFYRIWYTGYIICIFIGFLAGWLSKINKD